ncbi:Adenine deaminase [Faunimonas pinastri]|uniref:Adenine deaminase n=1 Tax=Faunimonas pinastri TaxID=1855383 RepID=A0A1H9Q5A0_9HYPH|nr:adenine deaminase C-terminal domain-containing protein [Faunimonas pinastri]SER55602.1 Adenine deaminase [Faunimonas pinastri]
MQEPHDLDDPTLRDRAVRAARGQEGFDVLLVGGTLVDMATNEVRPADIGLIGPLIASVHQPGTRSDAAEIIDIAGRFVAPGLIDTHMHVESSMVTPRRYAETVVPQGTTTICWDPHEVGNVVGLAGVRWAIEASRGLPLRALVLAPSCVPSAPGLEVAGADFRRPEMQEMLSWPEIAGVAEVMDMRGVIERDPRMSGIVGAGLESGKLVCGHGRELTGGNLQAFATAGIQSDHEIVSGDDILEKLRSGFTVELRGSHDYVLPGVVEALNSLPQIPQTLTLCTDDIFPDDLIRVGGIVDVVRRLVRYGLPPIDALRAATLNAAMRLGRRDLGLVAPGRRADLIVLADLVEFGVEHVFVSGRHVAENGTLREAVPERPEGPTDTVKVPLLSAEDFMIHLPGHPDGSVEINTVSQPRFTRWGRIAADVREGRVVPPAGTIVMAMIHRHGFRPAVPQLGILEGWSEWRGALATSVSHDSHNLTVFGRDPEDMAAAANAVIEAGGGMAVSQNGAVTALLPLPVCGLLSDAPTEEVAQGFRKIRAAAEPIADWQPPFIVFKSCVAASLACNPGPHVTDLGLADGKTGEFRPLIVTEEQNA